MPTSNPLVETLQEAFDLFRRRLMGNFFTYARDNGLTPPQLGTMFRIYREGGCGVSDIGNELGVTNSAASQMLERLVQLKLITRSENPTDRRLKQIVLTEKGRQILREGSLVNLAYLEVLASSMSDGERELVGNAMRVLIEKARMLELSQP